MQCPKCKKEMKLRKGAYGEFYGCTGYPNCKTTVPVGTKTPDGWSQLGDKLGAKTSPEPQNEPTRVLPQKDGFQVLTEHILSLETKVEEMITLIKEQLSL